MRNFKVDGIECEVSECLGISHTGSAPYCYNGDILVEPNGLMQVVAFYKNHIWKAKFDKCIGEKSIKEAVACSLRKAIKRFEVEK